MAIPSQRTAPAQPRYQNSEPIRIVLFGGTGVGKSSFVNDASRAILEVGHDLYSTTKGVQASPVFQIEGRDVQLYDTPGFDDTTLTDTQILKTMVEFLVGMYRTGYKITGLIYIHRITDNRMTGASVRAFDLFTKICGLPNMRNAMIVTNMWSYPADPEEDRRDLQLKEQYFKAALDMGARTAKRGGLGPRSALGILERLLSLQPIELQLQREIVVQRLPLDATQAGMLVDQNLRVKLERQRQEKEELEEELVAARQDRDRRAQDQLERYKRDREEEERILREQIELLREDRRNLAATAREAGPNPTAAASNNPALEQVEEEVKSAGKSGPFGGWPAKMFQSRAPAARGREQASTSRSAASKNPHLSRAETRSQRRSRSTTPVASRRRGFRFKSRFRMISLRRSRSEDR